MMPLRKAKQKVFALLEKIEIKQDACVFYFQLALSNCWKWLLNSFFPIPQPKYLFHLLNVLSSKHLNSFVMLIKGLQILFSVPQSREAAPQRYLSAQLAPCSQSSAKNKITFSFLLQWCVYVSASRGSGETQAGGTCALLGACVVTNQ